MKSHRTIEKNGRLHRFTAELVDMDGGAFSVSNTWPHVTDYELYLSADYFDIWTYRLPSGDYHVAMHFVSGLMNLDNVQIPKI